MRVLTVKQPWAWSLIYAGKPVENRTWSTSHRGSLAIHAGKAVDEAGFGVPAYEAAMARETSVVRHRLDLRGAVLGVVQLVDVHHADDGCSCDPEWAMPDQYHWVVTNPVPIDPILDVRGALGLWSPAAVGIQHHLDLRYAAARVAAAS